MSRPAGVVAVTCLALEAGIARGPGVSVICNQSSGLRAALGAAIKRGATGIISFGIAGGLAPGLVAGDWVVASGVTSGNGVIGEANNGAGAYGVWGKSSSGYAGYFSGRVNVTGMLPPRSNDKYSFANLRYPIIRSIEDSKRHAV